MTKRKLTIEEREFYYTWQHIELLPMEEIVGDIRIKFDKLQQIKRNMTPNDFINLQVIPDLIKGIENNKLYKYMIVQSKKNDYLP